jgi:hypothetical protein
MARHQSILPTRYRASATHSGKMKGERN